MGEQIGRMLTVAEIVDTLRTMAAEAEAMAARFSPGNELHGSLRRVRAAVQEAVASAQIEVGRRIAHPPEC
jgi:hypothetical protein